MTEPLRLLLAFRKGSLVSTCLLVTCSCHYSANIVYRPLAPEWPIVMVSSPTPSPSGESLAFAVARGEDGIDSRLDVRLWILKMPENRVSDTGCPVAVLPWMNWSPDSSKITFMNAYGHRVDWSVSRFVEIYDLESQTVAQIDGIFCSFPRFSPDGSMLGYVRDGPKVSSGADLVLKDLHTRKPGRTIVRGIDLGRWCWAGDGTEFYYIKERALFARNSASKTTRLIAKATGSDLDIGSPTPSPDGDQLGYYDDKKFKVVDLKSGSIRTLFSEEVNFPDFYWNERGILYLRGAGKAAEGDSDSCLMLYDVESGKAKEITQGPLSFQRWLNKDTAVFRKGDTEIWTVNVLTGEQKCIFEP